MARGRSGLPSRRSRPALIGGVAAGIVFSLLSPVTVDALEPAHYLDEFRTEASYGGSDGSHPWLSPWLEGGEADGAAAGAIQVAKDSHCHTGSCLRIGKGGAGAAQVTRAFYGAGASTIRLTFDHKRHRHDAGGGEVRLLTSSDGFTWNSIDAFPLAVEDEDQRAVSYDITSAAGPASLVRFELVGGTDDSHINVDNVDIVVTFGAPPVFNQDLPDRIDPEGTPVAFSAGATDPDGNPLLYWATGLPPGVTIDPVTGMIAGTVGSEAVDSSPYSVSVTVTDGSANTTQSFLWVVTDDEQPAQPPVAAREGEYLSFTPGIVDPDDEGNLVAYSASGLPDGLSIGRRSGIVSGTPAPGTSLGSPYSVVVVATEDGETTASTSFAMTVDPPLPPTTTSTQPTITTTTPPTTTTTTPPTTTTSTTTTTTTRPPTTTTAPTTTSLPPTTSTTGRPAVSPRRPPKTPPRATPTTVASPPTTTTIPPTPTTRVPVDETPRPSTQTVTPPPPTTTTTDPVRQLTVEEAIGAKERLVIRVDRGAVEPRTAEPQRIALEPRQGLAVTFVSSVETIRNNLMTSLALGLAVAVILLLGIDDRWDPSADAT